MRNYFYCRKCKRERLFHEHTLEWVARQVKNEEKWMDKEVEKAEAELKESAREFMGFCAKCVKNLMKVHYLPKKHAVSFKKE